jgi:GMP synthase-like glutamine amidotransferase
MNTMNSANNMNILIICMYSSKINWIKYRKKFDKTIKAKIYYRLWSDVSGIKKILKNFVIDGIIVTGSDYFILEKKSSKVPDIIFKHKIPILGICYGMEHIAIKHGKRANIGRHPHGELTYTKRFAIKYPFKVKKSKYYYTHTNNVMSIGKKYKVILRNKNKIDMMYNKKDKIIGIQFHPEKYPMTGKRFFGAWLNFINKA